MYLRYYDICLCIGNVSAATVVYNHHETNDFGTPLAYDDSTCTVDSKQWRKSTLGKQHWNSHQWKNISNHFSNTQKSIGAPSKISSDTINNIILSEVHYCFTLGILVSFGNACQRCWRNKCLWTGWKQSRSTSQWSRLTPWGVWLECQYMIYG